MGLRGGVLLEVVAGDDEGLDRELLSRSRSRRLWREGGLDPIWIERCRRLGRAGGRRISIWRPQMDGWEAGSGPGLVGWVGIERWRLLGGGGKRGEGWSGGGEGTDPLGIRV